MAQQPIVIGAADAGGGDTLFAAFTKVQANFDELYSDDAGDVNSVNGQTGTVVLDSDDITEGTTNLYNATHEGDVTGSTTLTIANDVVDHDELAPRYTTTAALVTTSGATTIDWSTAASFPITMGGAHTLNFSNYKKGQVVDLIINGAYAVTLGTTTGTPVFNKVGTQSYDTTTTNIIQVMCTDDDSTPNFFFAIGTYAVAQPQ